MTRKIIAYINERTNEQDADKIIFLNITYLRYCPLRNDLTLEALRLATRIVFALLTVGGDIKNIIDVDGTRTPTSEVTSQYFRSGANKVSTKTNVVYSVEKYFTKGRNCDGYFPIKTSSKEYGAHTVIISIDPKKKSVYRQSE